MERVSDWSRWHVLCTSQKSMTMLVEGARQKVVLFPTSLRHTRRTWGKHE